MKQKELESLIIEKNNQYRNGFPTISDLEYDLLLKDLKERFPTSHLFKKSIIEEIPISRKEKLPIQMYSLEQISNVEELRQWIAKYNLEEELLIITPKLDGNSICTFEGELKKCWTRGDGEYGQNCDKHFKRFSTSSIVLKNRYYYGEAMISKNNFSKVKELHPEYKNTRNGVAGLLKRDETSKALKFIDYIRYGVEDLEKSITNKLDQLNNCNLINRWSIPYQKLFGKNCLEENFNKYIEETYQYWKTTLDFEIDGLVIDINNNKLRQKLGKEINGNPIYSKKIKFGWEEVKETVILKRRWQVSKDGKLKPIAEIEPIELAGATISNVTLYNAKYCFDKGLGKGVKVKVRRSGEVIPEIVEVINPILNALSIVLEIKKELIEQNIIIDEQQITWDKNQINYILKERTDEWLIQEIVFFFDIMKLENFGEPSIRKIFNCGFRSIKQILELNKEQIMQIDGFGEITANYLLKKFKEWKDEGVELYRYATALNCFKGLGVKLLSQIKREYFFVGTWIHSDLKNIEGFKEIRINAFIDGYKIWRYYLKNLPIKIKEPLKLTIPSINGKFKGYKICFTQFRDKDLEQKILLHCGEVVSEVNKNTTHLILKEKGKMLSKEVKALKLGVSILTKEELENLINN